MAALKLTARTPEQDAAYFEARYIADRIAQLQRRDISEDEFGRIYLGTLHQHMMQALEPYLKAKASYFALLPSPGIIVHEDGRYEVMPPPSTACDAILLLDDMIERVKARYTQGMA